MRGSRTSIAAVGAASLALVLAGCGSSSSDSGSSADGVSVWWCAPQNDLVPININDACGGNLLSYTNSTLFRYDAKTTKPVKDLADSVTANSNNTVFTVKIRKSAKFSDGTDVKAKNFVDTWNYAAYGPNGQLQQSFFEPIKGFTDVSDPKKPKAKTMSGLKVTGDKSFTITTSRPSSDLLGRLGFVAYSPLPDSFFKDPKAFAKKPVGAGPYMVDSYTQGTNAVLVKNPNYGGGGPKGNVDKFNFKVYQDLDPAYNDLTAKNLDIMPDQLPPSALVGNKFKQDLGSNWASEQISGIQTIAFAPTSVDPSMNNVKLRHAISLAVDRNKVIKDQYNGMRQPATGWVAPGVTGYKAGACGAYCTYNPTEAKKLFKESGYNGKLTISYNEGGGHKEWVTATCNSIQQTLGVQCIPTPVADFATFRTKITKHQMKGIFRSAWQSDYPNIEDFLTPQYSTGGGANDNLYSDKNFDNLLKKAGAEKGNQANATYQQAERSLATKMPSIPLWYYQQTIGWSDKVTNVTIDKSTGMGDLFSVKTK